VTGLIYLVNLKPLVIAGNGSLAWLGAPGTLTLGENTELPIYDAMRWTNSYNMYIGDGLILTEPANPMSTNSVLATVNGICDFGPIEEQPELLLYDRSHPENIYRVIFHEESDPEGAVMEVVRATGTATGGILLNDNWSYFIDEDQANHDQAPYTPQAVWDNSHTLYVDNATGDLIYFP
jgi:hypothetical protein